MDGPAMKNIGLRYKPGEKRKGPGEGGKLLPRRSANKLDNQQVQKGTSIEVRERKN